MANLLALAQTHDQRLDHYTARLYRVSVHLRREELRAARTQLKGLREELLAFSDALLFPAEFIIAGAQLGLFSGKGAFVQGRLPAAFIGAMGGWMFGQHQLHKRRQTVNVLLDELETVERLLAIDSQNEQPSEA